MSQLVDTSPALQSEILDALSAHDRDFLLQQCQTRHYDKGETIFSRGDDGSWVLLIQTGTVEVSVLSLNGRKSIMSLMEPTEMLGEIALLDQQPRSADAIARTDVSGIVIHSHTFKTFLKDNNDCYMAIIRILCERVRNASDMFETQSLPNAGARLARSLLRIADKWGTVQDDGSVRIHQPLSQADLGDFAGIARENANRYLKTWTRDEILAFDKARITVLDRSRLAEIAEL